MSIICNVYLSTRDFHYSKETNCFTVEESTLSAGRTRRTFAQVYDDAIDEGFVLVSHVTGDSVVMALDHVDMDGDEVAGRRYKVVAVQDPKKPGGWLQARKLTALKTFTALVIND